MIEALIFLALFYAAYRVMGGITYKILLISSIANAIAYPFTSEYSVLLPATIDLITLSLIIHFSGYHWKLQAGLIFLAILCHRSIESDRLTGSNMVFDAYGAIITTITIGQLLGAGHAVITRLFERLLATAGFDNLCHSSCSPVLSQVKSKKGEK